MQPLDFHKLTPWAPDTQYPIFIGNMSLSKANLKRYTFTELAYFHKSPTVAVNIEDITKEAKAQNKFLQLSASSPSAKPLRPDISDIEIALIHSSHGNIPEEVLLEILNISKARLRQIREATKPLYHQKDTPLPNLPLITITDSSNYWTEDELMETYQFTREDIPDNYGKTYKDLLRRVEDKSKVLQMGVYTSLYDTEANKEALPSRTSIPSEVSEEDKEGYSKLSSALWSQVSRAEEFPYLLSQRDGGEDLLVEVDYASMVNLTRFGKKEAIQLSHTHTEGGYAKPLVIPKNVVELAVRYYNSFISNSMEAPAFERLVINLLVSLQYTSKNLGFHLPAMSSQRGHGMPQAHAGNQEEAEGSFIRDSPPLIYPQFNHKSYDYGIICHDCSTFLSKNTTNSCEHMAMETFLIQETGKFKHVKYQLPSIYLYSKVNTSTFASNCGLNYSLYYYNKDVWGSISSIYTLNLLSLYTNYSIPLHKRPFDT